MLVFGVLGQAGQKRHRDYQNNKNRKIILDHFQIAEIISAPDKNRAPQRPARNVIDSKPPIAHGANTGHKRRESADHRQKSRQNNGFAAILLVKAARALQIFPFKKS